MPPIPDDLPTGCHILGAFVNAEGEKWYLDGQEWTPPADLQAEGRQP